MNTQKLHYLRTLGIQAWQQRKSEIINHSKSQDDWESLREHVATCVICNQSKIHVQVILDAGNRQAEIMIISEDSKADGFIGRSEQLLTAMLQTIGVTKEQAYIVPLVKCDLLFEKLITFVNPKFILDLDAVVTHSLLKSSASFDELRGKINMYKHIPLLATYHPRYLLQHPLHKRNAYEDLRGLLHYHC